MIDPSLHANNNSMYNSAFQNFMVAPNSMSGGAQGFMNPAEAAIHQGRYGGGSSGLGSSPYGYMYDNPVIAKFAMSNGIMSRPTGTNYASTAMHRANVGTLVTDTAVSGSIEAVAGVGGMYAGGAAGMSAGAAIGAFAGPVGVAAGGFVGAIAGGIAGGMAGEGIASPFTDRMNQRTLEKMSVHKSLGGLANNNSPYGGGFGFSRKAAQRVYQNMEGLASEDAAFSTGEMTAILNEGINNGTISGNTVSELNEKLDKTKETIKALSQITGNNKIGELNDMIRQMVTVGFDSGAAENAIQGMSFAARRLGLDPDDYRSETIQRAQTRSSYGGPDAATGIMVSSAMDSYLANSDIFKTLGDKDKVREGKEGVIDWTEAQFTERNTPSLAMSGLVSQSTRSLLDDANAREAFAKENKDAIQEEMRTSGSSKGAATSNLFIGLSKEDRNPWLVEGVKTSDKKEKEMGIWGAYKEVRYKARELYSDSTARNILSFKAKSIKDATTVTAPEIAPIRGASQLSKTLVDTARGLDNQGGKFGLTDSMTQEIRAVVQQLKSMQADGGITQVDRLRQNDIDNGKIDLIKQNSTISASMKKGLAWFNEELVSPVQDWATPKEGVSEGLMKRALGVKNNSFVEMGEDKKNISETLKMLTERTMDGTLDLGMAAEADYARMSYFGNHGSSLDADGTIKGPQKRLETHGTLALGKTDWNGDAVFGADAVLALSTGGAVQDRYKKKITDTVASDLQAFNDGEISGDEFKERNNAVYKSMHEGAKGLDKIIRGAKGLNEKTELPKYVEEAYNSLTDAQKAQTNPYALGKEILEYRGYQVIASAKEKLGLGNGIATKKTSGQLTMEHLTAIEYGEHGSNGSNVENIISSGRTQYDSPKSQKEREPRWIEDENKRMVLNDKYKRQSLNLFGQDGESEGFYTEDSFVTTPALLEKKNTTSSLKARRLNALITGRKAKAKRVAELKIKENDSGLEPKEIEEMKELKTQIGIDSVEIAKASVESRVTTLEKNKTNSSPKEKKLESLQAGLELKTKKITDIDNKEISSTLKKEEIKKREDLKTQVSLDTIEIAEISKEIRVAALEKRKTDSSPEIKELNALIAGRNDKAKKVTEISNKGPDSSLTKEDIDKRKELMTGIKVDSVAIAKASVATRIAPLDKNTKELNEARKTVAKGTKEREDWSLDLGADQITIKNQEFVAAKMKVQELEGKKISSSEQSVASPFSPNTPSSGEETSSPFTLKLAVKGVDEDKGLTSTTVSDKEILKIQREELRVDKVLDKGEYRNVNIENISSTQAMHVGDGTVPTPTDKEVLKKQKNEQLVDDVIQRGDYRNVEIEGMSLAKVKQVGGGTTDTTDARILRMEGYEDDRDNAQDDDYGILNSNLFVQARKNKRDIAFHDKAEQKLWAEGGGFNPGSREEVAETRRLEEAEAVVNWDPDAYQIDGGYNGPSKKQIARAEQTIHQITTAREERSSKSPYTSGPTQEYYTKLDKASMGIEGSGVVTENEINGMSIKGGGLASVKKGASTEGESKSKLDALRQDKKELAKVKLYVAGTNPVAVSNALYGTEFTSMDSKDRETLMDFTKNNKGLTAIANTHDLKGTPDQIERAATDIGQTAYRRLEQAGDKSIISGHADNNIFENTYETKDIYKIREQASVDPSKAQALLNYQAMSPVKQKAAFDAAKKIGANRNDGSANATETALNSANIGYTPGGPLSEKEFNETVKPISEMSAFQGDKKDFDQTAFNKDVSGVSGLASVKGALKSIWKGVDLSSPDKLRTGQALHAINTANIKDGQGGMLEPELLGKIKNSDGSMKSRADIKGDLVANAAMDIYDDGKNKIIDKYKLPEKLADTLTKSEIDAKQKHLAKDELSTYKTQMSGDKIYSGMMDKIGLGGMSQKDIQGASRGGDQASSSVVGVLRSIEGKIDAAINAFANSKDGKVTKVNH